MSEHDGEYMQRLRALRWRLRTCWSWWVARRFRYQGRLLVGRDVPAVSECHRQHQADHSCPQHDGNHYHHWVRCVVTDKVGSRPEDATRCTVCGGRKCDMPGCLALRHHAGEHFGVERGSPRPLSTTLPQVCGVGR